MDRWGLLCKTIYILYLTRYIIYTGTSYNYDIPLTVSVGHFPPTASFFLFVEGFPTLWRITYRLLNIIFLRRRSCQTRRSRAKETLIIIFFSLFYTRFSFLFSPHEPVLFFTRSLILSHPSPLFRHSRKPPPSYKRPFLMHTNSIYAFYADATQ